MHPRGIAAKLFLPYKGPFLGMVVEGQNVQCVWPDGGLTEIFSSLKVKALKRRLGLKCKFCPGCLKWWLVIWDQHWLILHLSAIRHAGQGGNKITKGWLWIWNLTRPWQVSLVRQCLDLGYPFWKSRGPVQKPWQHCHGSVWVPGQSNGCGNSQIIKLLVLSFKWAMALPGDIIIFEAA